MKNCRYCGITPDGETCWDCYEELSCMDLEDQLEEMLK